MLVHEAVLLHMALADNETPVYGARSKPLSASKQVSSPGAASTRGQSAARSSSHVASTVGSGATGRTSDPVRTGMTTASDTTAGFDSPEQKRFMREVRCWPSSLIAGSLQVICKSRQAKAGWRLCSCAEQAD